MISPPYTPFAEHEVRHALGLSPGAYFEAVRTGALARSIHFDCRIGPTTALHSLVDVVRFDAMYANATERTHNPEFVEQCDWWLDALCNLDEDDEEFGQIAHSGDLQRAMRLVLPEGVTPMSFDGPADWHEELLVVARVINSWCRCYRALYEMLVANEIQFTAGDFGSDPGVGRLKKAWRT